MRVPETLRDDPYAAARFEAIVDYARRNNRFYAHWIGDAEHIPIIDRETFLDSNDAILNGYRVTDQTSGWTGIPVRISRSPERIAIEARDTASFIQELGGELPCAHIVYPNTDENIPSLLNIKEPLDRQIDFILQRHREDGAVAVTTFPTNAEMLAKAILEQQIDMSFIQRFGVYAEMFEGGQEELDRFVVRLVADRHMDAEIQDAFGKRATSLSSKHESRLPQSTLLSSRESRAGVCRAIPRRAACPGR